MALWQCHNNIGNDLVQTHIFSFAIHRPRRSSMPNCGSRPQPAQDKPRLLITEPQPAHPDRRQTRGIVHLSFWFPPSPLYKWAGLATESWALKMGGPLQWGWRHRSPAVRHRTGHSAGREAAGAGEQVSRRSAGLEDGGSAGGGDHHRSAWL